MRIQSFCSKVSISGALRAPATSLCFMRLSTRQQSADKDMQRILGVSKGDVLIWSADLAHGGGEIADPSATRQSIVAHYCPGNVYPMYRHYEGGSEIVNYGDGRLGCFARKVYWRSG